jgi:hypothetical protein
MLSSSPQEVLNSPVVEVLASIIQQQLEQQQQQQQLLLQQQDTSGDSSSSGNGSSSGYMGSSLSLSGSSNTHPMFATAADLLTQLSSQADGRAHLAIQLPLVELVR